jgi:hypothetical protein
MGADAASETFVFFKMSDDGQINDISNTKFTPRSEPFKTEDTLSRLPATQPYFLIKHINDLTNTGRFFPFLTGSHLCALRRQVKCCLRGEASRHYVSGGTVPFTSGYAFMIYEQWAAVISSISRRLF